MSMTTRPSDLSRRTFLAASAGTALVTPPSFARKPSGEGEHLWYRQPAARWEEALPLGNGRLGAMVFGRVAQERLQLNEDTLWSGRPYTPDNPQAREALPEVRRLLAAARYKEATELASAKVMARPLWQMSYGSLGDVLLDLVDAHEPADYRRELDLESAVCTTRYRTQSGIFLREALVSAPRQVIAFHMEAHRGRIGFDLAWRGPREVGYTSPAYTGPATPPAQSHPTAWLAREDIGENGTATTVTPDGEGCLLFTGRNRDGPDTPAGLSYALRIKVVTDGQVEAFARASRSTRQLGALARCRHIDPSSAGWAGAFQRSPWQA